MSAIPLRSGALRRTLPAILVVLVSGLNIFKEIVLVSKFRNLYQETLPGVTLPSLTQFTLTWQSGLIALDVGWLLFGIGMAYRQNVPWLLGLFFLIIAQMGVTVFALITPLTNLGISG